MEEDKKRGVKITRSNQIQSNIAAAASSSTMLKFKGVVPQQNGHWGAQIYANHQRIWLGTFKSEKEAASAYDSAAIKLRSGDSHRNFPWTEMTLHEPGFQSHYSTEAVLNMIKDGSYTSKFTEFLKTCAEARDTELSLGLIFHDHELKEAGYLYRELFQKELTPSDVGKLNRLVIPKKYAIKYFPHIEEMSSSSMEDQDGGGSGDQVDDHDHDRDHRDRDRDRDRQGGAGLDMTLTFHDRTGRSWKFRYCYWKSSQSFVFTRGWNRFVKEKELKSKDIVSFYRREYLRSFDANIIASEEAGQDQCFCMIDVTHSKDHNNIGQGGETSMSTGTRAGFPHPRSMVVVVNCTDQLQELDQKASTTQVEEANSNSNNNSSKPVVRLFGVDIS